MITSGAQDESGNGEGLSYEYNSQLESVLQAMHQQNPYASSQDSAV